MAWLRRSDGRQTAENSTPANDDIAACGDKPRGNEDGPHGVELLERKADDPGASGAPDARVYRTYRRRWFGLVQIVLLNIVVSWDVRCR